MDQQPADEAFERQFGLLVGIVWVAALAVVVLRGMDLLPFLLLSAYALGILYALRLRRTGDREGDTALWWAILVPPLAWWTFALRWFERRGRPIGGDPDEGPGEVDADLGYGPDEPGDEVLPGS